MKKKLALALCLAAALSPLSAFALQKIQCSGGAALIYTINSDGVVTGTRWVSEHPYCV